MPSTSHLSQLPVDPPDLISIFEANFYRFPPHGEHLPVPYAPHPARLHPLGEPLGLGYVFLHVAGSTPPLPYLLNVCPREQVALADLPAHLVPGKGYEITHLFHLSEGRGHEEQHVEVPGAPPLYTQPPVAGERAKLPRKTLA